MKKNIFAILFVLLLAFGIGCALHSDGNDVKPTDELTVIGVITGDIFFNDIAISQLFVEPFADILGPPLIDYGGNVVFYDGFEIRLAWDDAEESFNMAGQIRIANLNLLEIDGVAFNNLTRGDVITMLSDPIEYYEYPNWVFRAYYDDRSIRYHILGPEIDNIVEFWFEYPGDEVSISHINIWRMAR